MYEDSEEAMGTGTLPSIADVFGRNTSQHRLLSSMPASNISLDQFTAADRDDLYFREYGKSANAVVNELKWRPFRTHKDKLKRKLERRLRRRPTREPETGHEDDNLFDSEFSMSSLTTDGGIMWTSEAALSTENTDTDRGLEREGGLAFEHMLDADNMMQDRRVNKMLRRINITDPFMAYRNAFSDLPQMSAAPYNFTKGVHMITTLERLNAVVDLSKLEGYPNVTVITFLSYHVRFRQPCKMFAPFIDMAKINKEFPAILGVVDVGRYPGLTRASGAIVFPYTHIYVKGVKRFEFAGCINTLLKFYIERGCFEACPSSKFISYP